MSQVCYGFLGAGRMATALASGIVRAGAAAPKDLIASDPLEVARAAFAAATAGRVTTDNREVLAEATVVCLAVKPQQVADVLASLQGQWRRDHLLVSVAAGVQLGTLDGATGGVPRLVRVMPNTPCLIGEGASAYCLGPRATPEDGAHVARLLATVGMAHSVAETLLDAVTGLSGSGPAFVYVMVEALADGGVRMGLPRDVAMALAAQTVKGAAAMVLATGQHPGLLKDQVASPGGTTIAGLQALENGGVRAALINAVEAATRRSAELGAAAQAPSNKPPA
ncbi:MAG: pyrroline-5-carboxylate reductase [Pirellulales bacterium]|nr:pyrroline-5-carboxylate reductase [Pirellulales bacterium]